MSKLNPSAYLAGLNVDNMRFGLQAITALLSNLGNPQKSYKTILIAGTNGKGSTAAMTASCLRSAGYRVGLYTSPHLVDVRERMVVNGKKISLKDFSLLIDFIKNKKEQPVTYFEFLTAMAFLYFQNRKVDIAVLEVGLGGRLDATNVCKPLVSVITNIALEHTDYLGSTLELIAREKAGIIKQSGVCVTAVTQKKVRDVLKEMCLRRKSKLYCLGHELKVKKQKNGYFAYDGFNHHLKNLTIPLKGDHQLPNAAMALAAVECCEKHGFSVDESAMYEGLSNTHWEARLEVMHEEPLFLLDGAHNPAGMDVLCRSLKKEFSHRRIILVFGALADKNYPKMLQKIIPLASSIILTRLKTGRSASADDMLSVVKNMGYTATIAADVPQAVKRAFLEAGCQDLICATGSFYLAGEVKRAFRSCRNVLNRGTINNPIS